METPVLLRHLFDRESHNQGCKDLWRSNPKQPNRPTEQRQSVPEQGLLHALQAQLLTPPATPPGLLSMVTARPAATGAANPQMPAPSANEPSTDTHTPAGTAAPTTDIYLQEEEEQSGSVDAEIALLSEQRAMHVVHRYQTLSVNVSANADAQSAKAPEVLPPVSLYANLPQERPLARLPAAPHWGATQGYPLSSICRA